jgi:hypothetical protein
VGCGGGGRKSAGSSGIRVKGAPSSSESESNMGAVGKVFASGARLVSRSRGSGWWGNDTAKDFILF